MLFIWSWMHSGSAGPPEPCWALDLDRNFWSNSVANSTFTMSHSAKTFFLVESLCDYPIAFSQTRCTLSTQSPPLCVNNGPKGGMKSRLLSLESSTALKFQPKSFWSTRIINGGMNPQTKQLLVTCHQSPTLIGDYMLVHCWLYGQISSCVNISPAIQMFFSPPARWVVRFY